MQSKEFLTYFCPFSPSPTLFDKSEARKKNHHGTYCILMLATVHLRYYANDERAILALSPSTVRLRKRFSELPPSYKILGLFLRNVREKDRGMLKWERKFIRIRNLPLRHQVLKFGPILSAPILEKRKQVLCILRII